MTEQTPQTMTPVSTPGAIVEVESTAIETGRDTEDKALGDIYDKLMEAGITDDEAPAPQESTGPERNEKGQFVARDKVENAAAPQQPEGEGEQPGSSDRPSSLPALWGAEMADVYDAIPADKRDRVASLMQGVHEKMSDLGRQAAAGRDIKPIIDDMVQSFPSRFSGPNAVKPAEAINYLVAMSKAMDANPVETLLELGTQYGVINDLAKRFGGKDGQLPTPAPQQGLDPQALLREIADLKRQLNPEALNEQISQAMEGRQVLSDVERFAKEKPFYKDVETDLPFFIDKARAQEPEASRIRLLELAYEMAVYANPATRAKALEDAAKKAALPDATAKRAAAAQKAASINVTSSSSGKLKPMTEDEALGKIWEKHMTAA